MPKRVHVVEVSEPEPGGYSTRFTVDTAEEAAAIAANAELHGFNVRRIGEVAVPDQRKAKKKNGAKHEG